MADSVIGGSGNDTQNAVDGTGDNTKYDPKAGNDVVIGSTGNDTIIGGAGSDYLFGGTGRDQFVFNKFAVAGDHDYVVDFNLDLGDTLRIDNNGIFSPDGTPINAVQIVGARAELLTDQTFNGRNLVNDAKVYDLTLTLKVTDAGRSFTYEVTLMDVIKNQTYSADQYEAYLTQFNFGDGFDGQITFGGTTPA